MPTLKLSQIKAEKAKKLESTTIELDDGTSITLAHVLDWPDEALDLINREPVKAARLILGKDYARFREAGGTAGDLAFIVEQTAGATPGE